VVGGAPGWEATREVASGVATRLPRANVRVGLRAILAEVASLRTCLDRELNREELNRYPMKLVMEPYLCPHLAEDGGPAHVRLGPFPEAVCRWAGGRAFV
jgi:hypothetical protein